MQFFNYEEIYIAAHGDSTRMLEIFHQGTIGDNFIVNPKALVDARWFSDRVKAEYLGICALRNYEDYVYNKDVDLSIDLVPTWVPLDVIKKNPLIKVTETKIILLKEKV